MPRRTNAQQTAVGTEMATAIVQLHTRVGTLNLRVPRDRDGTFSTRLFERCQRSERALILALQRPLDKDYPYLVIDARDELST